LKGDYNGRTPGKAESKKGKREEKDGEVGGKMGGRGHAAKERMSPLGKDF